MTVGTTFPTKTLLIYLEEGLVSPHLGAPDFTKVGLSTLLWVRALIGTYDACK